jgi:penicillin-binding protein 1C
MQPPMPTIADGLTILSPRHGDVFLLEAGATESAQRLQFKLASPLNQTVEWLLNEKPLANQTPGSIFWVPKPGHWTLQVKSGDRSDRVSFEVQMAESRVTRRGFSVTQ